MLLKWNLSMSRYRILSLVVCTVEKPSLYYVCQQLGKVCTRSRHPVGSITKSKTVSKSHIYAVHATAWSNRVALYTWFRGFGQTLSADMLDTEIA